MVIRSVVPARRNGELIAEVAKLWIGPRDLVVDVTWGRGNFWTAFTPLFLVAHDLTHDGVDFRKLPENDGSVDVVVFDPPHLAPGGRATSTVPDMHNRYGTLTAPRTVREVDELHAAGIQEAARVLCKGGRLLVKCLDYVSSGRYHAGRHNVVCSALQAGFEQVDEFILVSGLGPQPQRNRDGSPRRQIHSRRAHSFLCVFRR